MKVLITGASGFIGRNVSAYLRLIGHQIVPLSRRTGIDYQNMLTPDDWLPYLRGIDAVINCVGIIGEHRNQRFEIVHTLAPVGLFDACRQAGVERVVQISALGSDESAFSAYHRSKLAADEALRSLDLDWFVLRPSLIYGHGGTSSGLFMQLARLPFIPVIDGGVQIVQPVHISDVVETIAKALISPETRQTLDIPGPESIRFAEWLQFLRLAQGLPRGREISVPFPLARGISQFARYINPIFQPENLDMLRSGYQADTQPIVGFLQRMPRRAEPRLLFSGFDIYAR